MSVSETVNWADGQLPDEPVAREQALRKRVMIHNFLALGGVYLGTQDGYAIYSPPIDVAETPDCPWHPKQDEFTACLAWQELRAGTIEITPEPVPTEALMEMSDEELGERVRAKRTAREIAEAKWRASNPVALKPEKRLTPEEAQRLAEATITYHHDAPRLSVRERAAASGFKAPAQRVPPKPTAAEVFGTSVPDEIQIDGEEDDE